MELTDTAKVADMLGALGSIQRLEIVRTLLQAGSEGLTVSGIQGKLDISGSTLSHHLEKLRNEGLIDASRESQWIRYRASLDTLGRLISFLCAKCYKPDRVQPLLTQIRSQCRTRVEDGKRTKKISTLPAKKTVSKKQRSSYEKYGSGQTR